MDKLKTKIKVNLTKLIKNYFFNAVQFRKKLHILNLFNTKQLVSVNCKDYLVLDSFKKYVGIHLHAFLISILYFNSAFLFNLKNEKA
jgi:hypothetical protein